MTGLWPVTILLASLFLGPALPAVGAPPGPRGGQVDLAAVYLEPAGQRLAAGDAEGAERLARLGLEFAPDYSELWFLLARILLGRQESTRPGLEALNQALRGDQWDRTDPDAARRLRAEVYLRTRRFEEARQALAGLRPENRQDPQAVLIRARSLIGSGRLSEAEAVLGPALDRHPYHSDLLLLLADLYRRKGEEDRASRLLDRGSKESPGAAALLYARAQTARPAKERLTLLAQYFELGGLDPEAAVLVMRLDPKNRERALERFLQMKGAQNAAALDSCRSALAGRPELQKKLEAALAGYSGERRIDSDRDGFYEESYRYNSGVLAEWILDRDQDGFPEARVEFREGKPVTCALAGAEGGVSQYQYSTYPWLEQAVLEHEGERRVYLLQPFRHKLEPLASLPSGDHPFTVRAAAALGNMRLSESELMQRSFCYELYEAGARAASRRCSLLAGKVAQMEEDLDLDGRFERRIEFEGGRPVSGLRDEDGDGYAEVREEYREGRLARISWDQNRDGRPEYLQVLGARFEEYWDYNGDGVFDCRLIEDGSGKRIREFSSALNGVFDRRTILEEKKP